MAPVQRKRVMLDPSFLVSSTGVEWLSDPRLRQSLIVPRSVGPWLRGDVDLPDELLIAPDDAESFSDRRGTLVDALEGVPTFSTRDADLSRSARSVLDALGREGEVGEIRSEEWAFLFTHSTLLSKIRQPLDAFLDAGAVILEVGSKVGRKFLEEVIPKERIDEEIGAKLIGLGAAKWVVVGAATAGGGTLGGLLGAVVGGPAGGFLGNLAGGIGGEKAASAALLAVDP